MARLVAPGVNRLLQPRNSLIEIALLDHVRANVVVGIAKIGIDLDGAAALSEVVSSVALEVIRPAKECGRFGRGMQTERGVIEFDSAIVVAFHLSLIGVLRSEEHTSELQQ